MHVLGGHSIIIPKPDLVDEDLEHAIEVWKKPTDYNIEEIQHALSTVRYWHADRTDLLRRAKRGTDAYNEIKSEEEVLEVYMTDLKDAMWMTAHTNKLTNGAY